MAMERQNDPQELQATLRGLRRSGKRIGLCPTMGALHAGHLSLVKNLSSHCDIRVVSIFVNPTQFNDPKDYAAYVIDLERDLSQLKDQGVDFAFTPSAESMYPKGAQTSVTLSNITQPLEGLFRPGHFAGVSTVVASLFNIVQPDVAIFGEKDFQQLRLIESMVRDLHFGIKILRGKTVREEDGLALSSRNARLSASARKEAVQISKGLSAARASFTSGVREATALISAARSEINKISEFNLEYLEIVNEETLAVVDQVSTNDRILVAMHLGGVRLIDNMPMAG